MLDEALPNDVKPKGKRRHVRTKKRGTAAPGGAAKAAQQGRLGGFAGKAAVGPIREGLDAYVGLIGMSLSLSPRTAFDGQVILERGPHMTDALCTLAEQNPNVRRALKALVAGSAWGAVILAGANMALPIAAHHGMIPLPIPAETIPDLCDTSSLARMASEMAAGEEAGTNGDGDAGELADLAGAPIGPEPV